MSRDDATSRTSSRGRPPTLTEARSAVRAESRRSSSGARARSVRCG